jgi:hypothetical protein
MNTFLPYLLRKLIEQRNNMMGYFIDVLMRHVMLMTSHNAMNNEDHTMNAHYHHMINLAMLHTQYAFRVRRMRELSRIDIAFARECIMHARSIRLNNA